MKQRGFTVIELVLVIAAVAVLAGVGYFVVQKRGGLSSDKYSTSSENLERLKNEDSYYQAQVYVSASDEERARSADNSPNLRKVNDDSQLCGAGQYQVLDDNGNVVACIHGGE